MLFLSKNLIKDCDHASKRYGAFEPGWWIEMLWSDLIGKDGGDVAGSTGEKTIYSLVLAVAAGIGAVATAPTVVGPIVLGAISIRKFWIVLHKIGVIPFG